MWLELSSNQMWRFITSETDGWTRYSITAHSGVSCWCPRQTDCIPRIPRISPPLIQFTPFLISLLHDPAVCGVVGERGEGYLLCPNNEVKFSDNLRTSGLGERNLLASWSVPLSLPPCITKYLISELRPPPNQILSEDIHDIDIATIRTQSAWLVTLRPGFIV